MKVVIYHRDCTDGTAAMQVARKALGAEGVTYVSMHYNEGLPEILLGTNEDTPNMEVYILDFSFPRQLLLEIKAKVKSMIVLDHHKTAIKDLEGIEGCHFDMERSGAGMTWDYFFPDSPRPVVIDYVEDRDLWRFQLPQSKELNAYIKHRVADQRFWDTWLPVTDPDSITVKWGIEKGKLLTEAMEASVRSDLKKVRYINFQGYRTTLINVTKHISEVGHAICKELNVDFSMTYFISTEGDVTLSFRSNNGFDVGSLAESLGGGGHKSAAGVKTSISYLRTLYGVNASD